MLAIDTDPIDPRSDALSVELGILSRPGGRENNEDAGGHWQDERHVCCVLADGAGGHGRGDVAARLAVRHLLERCAAAPPGQPEALQALLSEANHVVIRHRADDPAQAQMHSTVVGLFIDLDRRQALWGHAGDSRLYVFREGQMLVRTRDHSVVQALVDAGAIGPHQIRSHPRRSELISALGCAPEQLLLTTTRQPWRLQVGDVFLLCTDGLWEYVNEAEMSASLGRALDPGHWLALLEHMVLRSAARQGKTLHDNFSGVSVWVREASTQL